MQRDVVVDRAFRLRRRRSVCPHVNEENDAPRRSGPTLARVTDGIRTPIFTSHTPMNSFIGYSAIHRQRSVVNHGFVTAFHQCITVCVCRNNSPPEYLKESFIMGTKYENHDEKNIRRFHDKILRPNDSNSLAKVEIARSSLSLSPSPKSVAHLF